LFNTKNSSFVLKNIKLLFLQHRFLNGSIQKIQNKNPAKKYNSNFKTGILNPHHNHQNKTPPHEQKPIWQDKQDRRQRKPRPDLKARQNAYKRKIRQFRN
jgi:hypothetical protein